MSRPERRSARLSSEERKIVAKWLRWVHPLERQRRERLAKLPRSDPQRKASGYWETPDEQRRIEEFVERLTPRELRKLVASYPSTARDPVGRAVARLEQEARRKGGRATAEKKRAAYAAPEVVRDVAAHVDRMSPGLLPRKRNDAIRRELQRLGAPYPPKKNFHRWLARLTSPLS